MNRTKPISLLICVGSIFPFAAVGCVPRTEDSVVVYSAADREYAQPILGAFERRHAGTEVVEQFDVESTKTVGLVTRIESEAQRPRADLFWNNEIMHTLRLEQAGLLQSISWDIPNDWPASMRSASGHWVGIAARARVLLINRQRLPDESTRPNSVIDLADPKWQQQCGVALPLFGTTATHFTVLRQTMGAERAAAWFKEVKSNAMILSGNKQVAQAVSSGKLAFGLTDTDDALVEIDAGLPVEIVYPDQLPDQWGALRIPNTIAVLAGAPHPHAAEQLANFLVSADTEGRLAMGLSGQFPVRPGHPQPSRAQGESLVRWMEVDFQQAAQGWVDASDQMRSIFRD